MARKDVSTLRDEAARAVQTALEIDATHEGAKAQKAALNLH